MRLCSRCLFRGWAVWAFPTISRLEYCLIALFTPTLICRAGCVELFPPPLPFPAWIAPTILLDPSRLSYTIFITAHGAGAEFGFVPVIKHRTCSLSTPSGLREEGDKRMQSLPETRGSGPLQVQPQRSTSPSERLSYGARPSWYANLSHAGVNPK